MIRLATALLALSLAASPALAADGAQLYNLQCKLCHQGPASTPLAPTLVGVTGKKIASRPDFNYSGALKAKGGKWTDANLEAWLANPRAFASGAKMVVSVPSAESRKAIIDYLKTLK
ncbi:MAG TPA: c-type cytochrome [Phenylobacterium sp.]|jgi:cytochrome c|nr:c-type cytochrome [Phenylobacterium sp.]